MEGIEMRLVLLGGFLTLKKYSYVYFVRLS